MTRFECHTETSAPDAAKPLLKKSVADFGMIPNLHAVMAEAPTVLDAYQQLHDLALASSFNDTEKTVLWQTINVEHGCHYCVPVHSAIARQMQVSEDVDNALRNHQAPGDKQLDALRDFTLAVVRNRGQVNDELQAFLDAGYTKQQVLEVILFVSQKVMSNYINHIVETPLDKPFEKFTWQKNA